MRHFSTILFIACCLLLACNEKELLQRPSDTNQLEISSLDDAQSLLDNMSVMSEVPSLGEISSDDYYVSDNFRFDFDFEKNAYQWQPDIFGTQGDIRDWKKPYEQIWYTNEVLQVMPRLRSKSNLSMQNRIEGTALFLRSFAFFQLAQLFAPQYDSATAATMPGIPLRLETDPTIKSTRATLQQTYDRIIQDLKAAIALLPSVVDSARKNRPSRAAAFALMARVYLVAGDYVLATKYADSSLQLQPKLLDYNYYVGTIINPFSPNNAEVLYQCRLHKETGIFLGFGFNVDSSLYRSYESNDLRKEIFFTTNILGLPVPNYTYSGDIFPFAGLGVDEMYLVRAEGYARSGNTGAAVADINTLLSKRWKAGSFIPVNAGSPELALDIVLKERRKELVYRGLRWIDIRRLNKKNQNISLTRVYNNQTYTLPANDRRFVLPIPPDVIQLSGMPQNPR